MGLQVWYPLINDMHNQGVGDTDLVVETTPTFGVGKIGNALISGGNSHWTAAQSEKVLNNKAISICFWVYVDAPEGDTNKRAMFFGNNGKRNYSLFQYPSCNDFHWSWYSYDSSSTGTFITGGALTGVLPSYKWTHVAITYSNPNGAIYINGEKKQTFSGVMDNYTFSNQTQVIYQCEYRKLNDFRIYDHCLSPREVKEISKGLVLHYPLAMPGQENLYTGSRDFSGTWVSGANWTTDSEQYNGFVVKKKSSVWGGLAQNISCSNGDIFTISFYAKVDSGGNILSIHRSSLGNVTTGLTILGGNFKSGTDWVTASDNGTEWKRYWATVEITSQDITYLQWRIENSVANKYLYVCGMKLERGSIATPWIPNPADTAYTTIGFNDGIEYDVSGYGHNGTKYGTLTYSSDTPRYNTSAVFNGTDNCIQFPFNDFCVNGDVFTMNIWWKKTALGTKAYETLIGGPAGFEMDTRSGSAQYLSLYMASTRGGNVYPSFNMNEWYMVTLVNDGTNELYYVNGTLVKTIEKKNMPSGNYYVGAWKNETGQNFNGFMADFRFYKTALSADDILELYHTPISLSNNGTLLTQGEYVES